MGGRRAGKISGPATAVMSGTHSTREECARRASSGGLKLNAFRATAGRRTQIGMRNNQETETTNVAPALRSLLPSFSGIRPDLPLSRNAKSGFETIG